MKMLKLIARRAIVTTVVVASVALGFVSIQAAAQWTAASAPLAAPPVSAETITAQLTTEQSRSSDLQTRLDGVTAQADQLAAALKAAGDRIAADAKSASDLRTRLAQAQKKLGSTNASNAGASAHAGVAASSGSRTVRTASQPTRVVRRIVKVTKTGAPPPTQTPPPGGGDDGGGHDN